MDTIYKVETRNGYRFYKSYESANRDIEKDIKNMQATIISDTRNGNIGEVLVTYITFGTKTNIEIYTISRFPIYD